MSTTISLTDACSDRNRQKDHMKDSGVPSLSLRLTHSDDTSKSMSNTMAFSESNESQPAVSMPGTSTLSSSMASLQRQDSGLCSDLMTRLSISGRDELQELSTSQESWQEFYEPDEDGDVQLHLAIASGYTKVVDQLISMVPSHELLNIQNNQMYAPLHIAVMRNRPDIVRSLVVAGARLDVQDLEGNTPLHLAARRGHVECGETLLNPVSIQEMVQRTGQSGVSSTATSLCLTPSRHSSNVLDLPNYHGECCVHLASMGGHVNFLQFLSWNNADMNAQEGRAGRTALHFAVGSRNLTVIKCLMEARSRGCGVNPNLLDWYGHTAYQLSIINCLSEVTHYMASCSGIDLQDFDSENSLDSDFEAEQAAILLNSNA